MIKLFHVLTDTNTGGAGVLLLNQLKHFRRDLFDITVVLPEGSEIKPKINSLGYPVVETRHCADRSFELEATGEYMKIIKAGKPDIIHCHGALSARIAAYVLGVPVRIYTRHCAYKPPLAMRVFPFKQICGAINGALSTAVVAVADAAAENLTDTGTPKEKIKIIINGVEPLEKLGDAERRRIRRELGFSEEDFVAGIFARLEKCKGHIHLLLALAEAAEAGDSRLKVLVLGKGSLDQELRLAAKRLGIAGRVAFAGFAEDVTPYMNAVDVNVNCSIGTETSSLALSEGMSLGKPAVVSDYGGNPHMIEDGVSGIVYPAADAHKLMEALTRLESSPGLVASMGAAAYARFKEYFTAAAMTQKLEELYIRLYSALNNS
jgi:glycosyltransferase involved in cell wall biosynthesis